MSLSASALAPIAAQMRIPASALIALPAVIEVFAKRTGMTTGAMVIELLRNAPLRDYAAQMCITAAEGEAA